MTRAPAFLLVVLTPLSACAGSSVPSRAGAAPSSPSASAATSPSASLAPHKAASSATDASTDGAATPPRRSEDAGGASLPDALTSPRDASAASAPASADAHVASAPIPRPTDRASTDDACPEDMVLIDGDYCENLEMDCLRSTYAAQNKKTICWDFKEPTVCAGPRTHKRFCIDRFEYPNRQGAEPRVMVNFPQAQALCADRGKRVCTETEWTTACEGPKYKPYPYGYHRDPKVCNGDRPYPFPDLKKAFSADHAVAAREVARTYAAVPSGSQLACVSDYGVYDMPGNADELASSETSPPRSPYDNVTTGGPWLEGVRNQCRPKIYTHNEGFAYYYLSFRCCAEPDGSPTDPRSPKQIRREEKWRRAYVPAPIYPPTVTP